MNRYILILTAVLFSTNTAVFSQTPVKVKKHLAFYTGMGINFGITPDFTDFLIKSIPYSTSDSIKTFNAGIEFFGGLEYDLGQNISAGVDYSYYIRSLSYTYSPAVFDFTITNHQPYIFINYTFRKPKFDFKSGLMLGYHFQQLDNKINNSTTLKYTSSGASIRADFSLIPKLSRNFFFYLNGFAFYNIYGSLKDENKSILYAPNSSTEVNLKGYGIGARVGILFNIN